MKIFYEALKFISVFCAGTNHSGGEGNICARIPSLLYTKTLHSF